MDGAASNALAAIIRAKFERVRAANHAQIFPVELVRAGFVADPILLGVPEGAGLETDNVEPGTRQPLQQDTTGGADANDHVVDLFAIAEAMLRDLDLLNGPEIVRVAVRWFEGAEHG